MTPDLVIVTKPLVSPLLIQEHIVTNIRFVTNIARYVCPTLLNEVTTVIERRWSFTNSKFSF